MITADVARTARRIEALERYFAEHVFEGRSFHCCHYAQCARSNERAEFRRGQLHHVGRFYDLRCDGTPYRIAVIGQEFGGGKELVTLEQRRMELDACKQQRQRGSPRQAGVARAARNQHMTGTTSLLRVLLELPLEGNHDSEFVDLEPTGSAHIFDMFALVNALLCSRTLAGRSRGRSTRTMRRNCLGHLRAALLILEPRVIIVESKGYWPEIRECLDEVNMDPEGLYHVRFGEHEAVLARLSHPSAGGKLNWGNGTRRPYLLDTVAPMAEAIRRTICG